MHIWVDADACPVVGPVERIAAEHGLSVTLLCDTNHVLTSDYSEVCTVGVGAHAVDLVLVNHCKAGDLVVTQDYGVAALALSKGARSIHQSGMWYTPDNIDGLLAERHLSGKARRAHEKQHRKGPHKRTAADDAAFAASLERLLTETEQTETAEP